MLLKSLELKDFRQFKGEQTIAFATESERNVTIILGENGSGKTSLAQAFTWCLYGKTDFDDPILLCKSTSLDMLPGDEKIVRVTLTLTHAAIDYTITSEQRYKRLDTGVQIVGQRKFAIAYKGKDGQQEFVPELHTETRMKEILPSELSKYFFFDGERIGNMSKELRRGKSREFADAVRSLLGLSAFTSAMYHLKGQGTFKSVLRSYDEQFDASADSRIGKYTEEITRFNEEINQINNRLEAIESETDIATEKIKDLSQKLLENEASKDLQTSKEKLVDREIARRQRNAKQTSELFKAFCRGAPSYFAKKMMKDCLQQLSDSQKINKGIPDIHARTLDHIIERGRCICGNEISTGNDAFNELNKLREYIPPQSLGNLIEQFRQSCEITVKSSESYFDDIRSKYSDILSIKKELYEIEEEKLLINSKIEGLLDVGKLQVDLSKYQKKQREWTDERSELDKKKGAIEANRNRAEAERHELTLKDKNNRQIETYKAYTMYLYEVISDLYSKEESRMREMLSTTINEIFRGIYAGGLSLSLDAKYNVEVSVDDQKGYSEGVETSTAQSISIIFAFIAGVIKMARESKNIDEGMLVSEPYPLVMDAPLSAFDTTRIKTVSDALPKVAEQVIIFIKDTDGEIAEKYMAARIGSRAKFRKVNEFETYIEERE